MRLAWSMINRWVDEMDDGLNNFIQSVDALIKNLSPAERSAMLRTISIEVRKRNAARVRGNIQPDGSPMAGRQGDRWKMRGLRNGEALLKGKKFNYFKQRDLALAYIRQEGKKIIGRKEGEPKKMSGYLRENIYFDGRNNKKARMFQKISRPKYLRSKNTSNEAIIGFLGDITAKIAAEHHYGDSRKNLTSRELVGLSDSDLSYIETEIIKSVAKGI